MNLMKATVSLLAGLLLVACSTEKAPVVVGSKNFTESVILGELLAQQLEGAGCTVDRRLNMGGTLIADGAIRSGGIDTYVEYSGTALTAIFHHPVITDPAAVRAEISRDYAAKGLRWGPELGFNNTFAMIVRKSDAAKYGLATIADLAKVSASFQPGFGYEFVERPDGWNGLLKAYSLQFQKPPKTMDLGLTYKALAAGEIDLIAGNSTDGLIESLGLVVLGDVHHYFPPYDAGIVSAPSLDSKCRSASRTLAALKGTLDEKSMRGLNYEVDGEKRDVAAAVREFRKQKKL
jgi:glycine betaine/choline ABC-type transport system substrate-binding protein